MSADDSEAATTMTDQFDQQTGTGVEHTVVEVGGEVEQDAAVADPATETDAGAGSADEPVRETVPTAFELTGEPAVDAVLERLSALGEHGPAEHVRLYDEAHEHLQQFLTDVDAADADSDGDDPGVDHVAQVAQVDYDTG